MSDRLQGKTAVVTGAGSGIGRAIAQRFSHEGARVVFTDVNIEAATDAAGQVENSLAVHMDVSDELSVSAAFEGLTADGYAPDILVVSAGVQLFGKDAPIADLDLDVWRRTIDINLTGAFLSVKHGVRSMLQRGGSIVLIGSPTALNGEGQAFTAYSSSKAGMHGLGRAVAGAYASQGIRVNTIVPGYTETPLVSAISTDPVDRAAIVSRIPLGRPGQASDVEGIAVFLASDESSFATGATFQVDGGMTTL
ncbi:NAD(P)-dependent dehydrogenase (short-subunit alcohol dehydrogenase family) [Okibacterium sp. HSC-33S16]|uniref:SDR family NAD(P)-dependent oxidoreductase n=1 Tax=Okibacterium sp. HSC-33S16 TaxID=2910965 RepID=UPI00209DCB16|nr:SDR family NAD(P)-dependent oxidoreductase [Okibacterium sp. HSC-33S16]MCP2031168.1 NAD(P)-dependent dehydrogenase (short-subunit alcohol dehydrogenase family) [Okibacterium sp. HSC-33S16]